MTAAITGRMVAQQPTMADFEFDVRGLADRPPPNRRTYRFLVARAVRDGAMSTAEGIRRLFNAGMRGPMLNPWHDA